MKHQTKGNVPGLRNWRIRPCWMILGILILLSLSGLQYMWRQPHDMIQLVESLSSVQMHSPHTQETNEDNNAKPLYMTRALPRPSYNITLSDNGLLDSITVVTAYFKLGKFIKGASERAPNVYMQWIEVLAVIKNPLIAYFDNPKDITYFKKIRGNFNANTTKLVLVSRDDLWSFGLHARIAEIIGQPGYPKFHPNTVVPQYASAMHAKYELMFKSVLQNPFKSKYFCWLDVGLFRDLAGKPQQPFDLHLPPNFDVQKVAYTEVNPPLHEKVSIKQIFLSNQVWLCGGFFLAEHNVMFNWAQEYMTFVDYFLAEGYSNTDQQFIYAMFNRGSPKPRTSIQTYQSNGKYKSWFHLGYLCKER